MLSSTPRSAAADEGSIECSECGEAFRNEGLLEGHAAMSHLRWSPVECGYCSTYFGSAVEARAHLNRRHAAQPPRFVYHPDDILAAKLQKIVRRSRKKSDMFECSMKSESLEKPNVERKLYSLTPPPDDSSATSASLSIDVEPSPSSLKSKRSGLRKRKRSSSPEIFDVASPISADEETAPAVTPQPQSRRDSVNKERKKSAPAEKERSFIHNFRLAAVRPLTPLSMADVKEICESQTPLLLEELDDVGVKLTAGQKAHTLLPRLLKVTHTNTQLADLVGAISVKHNSAWTAINRMPKTLSAVFKCIFQAVGFEWDKDTTGTVLTLTKDLIHHLQRYCRNRKHGSTKRGR